MAAHSPAQTFANWWRQTSLLVILVIFLVVSKKVNQPEKWILLQEISSMDLLMMVSQKIIIIFWNSTQCLDYTLKKIIVVLVVAILGIQNKQIINKNMNEFRCDVSGCTRMDCWIFVGRGKRLQMSMGREIVFLGKFENK